MSKIWLMMLFSGLLAMGTLGCSGETSTSLENADQSAIDEYQRLQEEEQAKMGEEMESNL